MKNKVEKALKEIIKKEQINLYSRSECFNTYLSRFDKSHLLKTLEKPSKSTLKSSKQ